MPSFGVGDLDDPVVFGVGSLEPPVVFGVSETANPVVFGVPPCGRDGREIELRVDATMLQWRYTSPPGLPWVGLADLGGDGTSVHGDLAGRDAPGSHPAAAVAVDPADVPFLDPAAFAATVEAQTIALGAPPEMAASIAASITALVVDQLVEPVTVLAALQDAGALSTAALVLAVVVGLGAGEASAGLDAHASSTTGAHGGIVSATDARLTDARTPTAHAASHAPGGSDVLGVGHFAPDLPGALGLGRRVGANATVTRGMCMWIPMPLLAVPAKATTIWVKTATGVASCAMTGAICAAKSASLDAPGTILGSTSVGAMSLASSSAVVGGTLTSPVTLAAGVRYFVQIIALNGASNPTVQGADGLTEGNNWEKGSAGPVTPTAQVDTAGIFVWSGRSALENDPARASYVTSSTKPFVYVSLEAP